MEGVRMIGRMGRRRWIAGLLLLGLLATVGMWMSQRQASRVFAFPDGTRWAFLGVTSGTNHVQPGRGWAHPLSHLPSQWLTRLGLKRLAASSIPVRTGRPTVIAYFERKGAAAPGPAFLEACSLGLMAVDEAGFEIACGWGGMDGQFAAIEVEVFARRSPVLRLKPVALRPQVAANGSRVWDRIPMDLIELPNPSSTNAIPWRAATFPQSCRKEGLEVILDRVWLQPKSAGKQDPTGVFRGDMAVAELRFLENGLPTDDWVPWEMELSDATGNRISWRAEPNLSRAAGNGVGRFREMFEWRQTSTEGAWKLCCRIRRDPSSAPRPGEVSWLRGLDVPASDGISEVRKMQTAGGLGIEVLALVGDQAHYPGRPHDVMDLTIVEVQCGEPEGAFDLGLTLLTPGGVELHGTCLGEGKSYGFAVPPGVSSVDLRLVVQRRVEAEFLIRPEFPAANPNAKGRNES